jgi:outer membrane immunogenic protein
LAIYDTTTNTSIYNFGAPTQGGTVSWSPGTIAGLPTAYAGVTTLTSLSGSGNSNNVGWALGGGLEWALTNTWSVRAEYLHVDLGKNDRSFTTLASNTINVSNNNKFDVVRAGLNWRF